MYYIDDDYKLPGHTLYKLLNRLEKELGLKNEIAMTGSIYLTTADGEKARISDHARNRYSYDWDLIVDVRVNSKGVRDRIKGVKEAAAKLLAAKK